MGKESSEQQGEGTAIRAGSLGKASILTGAVLFGLYGAATGDERTQRHVRQHRLGVNMTLCHDKCESGCKEYLLPGKGKCYNARQLFPGDRQWGVFDIRDVCVKVRPTAQSMLR